MEKWIPVSLLPTNIGKCVADKDIFCYFTQGKMGEA